MDSPGRITALRQWVSVTAVWVVAAACAVALLSAGPAAWHARGFSLTLGAAVLATMLAQLVIRQRSGLVARMILSLAGSVVIVAVAAAVSLTVARLA